VFCTKIVYKLSFNQIKIKNKPCVTWGFGSKDDNRNSESFTGYSLSPKLIIESKPVEEIHDFWSSDNDDNTRTSILGLILTIVLSWLRKKTSRTKKLLVFYVIFLEKITTTYLVDSEKSLRSTTNLEIWTSGWIDMDLTVFCNCSLSFGCLNQIKNQELGFYTVFY